MPKIWTPSGSTDIAPTRNTTPITPEEMSFLERFHTIAQKYRIAIICPMCMVAFQGLNTQTDATQSIACDCRELRATRRKTLVS